MKKLNRKKGFTIVELVIVIAVVGVLTAVLVPTFVNLTNRAKEAENQTFVRNINTQLAVEEADPSVGRYERVSDAIKSAQRMGFDVTKLTPVDGNDIVWDSAANRFAIVKPAYAKNPINENVVYSDGGIKATALREIWKMYEESEMPTLQNQNYSIYAKGDWSATDVTVATGFDGGGKKIAVTIVDKPSESSLIWTPHGSMVKKAENNARTLVVETYKRANLTVDSAEATVIHYGEGGYETFNNVAKFEERGSYKTRDNKAANSIVDDSKATGTGTNNILAAGTELKPSEKYETAVVKGEGVSSFSVNGTSHDKDVAVIGDKTQSITKSDADGLIESISEENYVLMNENADISSRIQIDHSMTIDGNGKTIKVNNADNRVMDLSDTSNVTLNLVNLELDGSGAKIDPKGYARGISLYNNENVALNLRGTGISSPYYAINVAGANRGVEINVEDTSLASGWAALNVWSPSKITVKDSDLAGTNDKTYNNKGSNNFGTIVLNYESSSVRAKGSELDFQNTTITAISTNGNRQLIYDVRDDYITAKFTGCTFISTGSPNGFNDLMFLLCEHETMSFENCRFIKNGEELREVDEIQAMFGFYGGNDPTTSTITIDGEKLVF